MIITDTFPKAVKQVHFAGSNFGIESYRHDIQSVPNMHLTKNLDTFINQFIFHGILISFK